MSTHVQTSGFRGAGTPMQLMKLSPDKQATQSEAGEIILKDILAIQVLNNCNVQINGNGDFCPVFAGDCYECADCSTIVTDAPISYRWM